jgi:predicted chitinase
MNALAPMMNVNQMNTPNGMSFPTYNTGNFGGMCGCNQMGGLQGLNGNSMMGQSALGMDQATMQQAVIAQQLQAVELLLGMMIGMIMGNAMGQGQNGQNALQSGLANNFGGPSNGNSYGGPAASQGGGGGGSSPAGSSSGSAPASSSSEAGAPAGNYSGPINVEKVVNSLPSGYQKAARANFPGILAECQKQGVTDKAQIAYILATTVHESGAGASMTEFASGEAYNGRRDLGNTQPGDGPRYKGRGYVQITGRNNYTNWGKKLGLDLVGNPDLAKQPGTAARILVQGMKEGSFTGKKLSDYVGGGRQDFEGARRIVNGTNKASTFADTARKILSAMN